MKVQGPLNYFKFSTYLLRLYSVYESIDVVEGIFYHMHSLFQRLVGEVGLINWQNIIMNIY